MTNVLEGAEKTVSTISDAADAVSTVETIAGDATKLASGAVGGVAKLATGALSGLLSGFMPYILGAAGVAALSGWGVAGFQHYVTIPHLESQDALDKAATAQANVATTEANQNEENLRNVITDDNRKMEAIAHQCMEQDQAADVAGIRAVTALPPPPAGNSAAVVYPYWLQLNGKKP